MPDVALPLLPSPIVYVMVEFVSAVATADLLIVKFGVGAVFTVVVALAQLVVEQEVPGVAGFVPPEGSTDA